MEPGLRDREYDGSTIACCGAFRLQWSPVLETGNTPTPLHTISLPIRAAMEPGLRDREYVFLPDWGGQEYNAAMEPGLRDREYERFYARIDRGGTRCNGARS